MYEVVPESLELIAIKRIVLFLVVSVVVTHPGMDRAD